jgi:hypothetical protein
VDLLSSGSHEGRAKVAGLLGNLMCGNDAIKTAIMAAGALPPLIELMSGGSDRGKAFAAGALRSLVIGNDAAVVAAGALSPLVELLRARTRPGLQP